MPVRINRYSETQQSKLTAALTAKHSYFRINIFRVAVKFPAVNV